MHPDEHPREVKSVLLEEFPDDVVVTWALGDLLPAASPEYWGGEVYYYAPDGNGGKRFGVRLHAELPATAHIFDNDSNTQANYLADHITVRSDAIVVRYRDASIGLSEIGTVLAYTAVDGVDSQTEIPVTVIR